MDTRFWGPSGWRLFHLMVATPLNGRDLENIEEFYTLLPYVLPCKFCRQSLTIYYRENPIPKRYNELNYWLYKIHNKVNDKLRQQKLLSEPNPTFDEVKDKYKKWSESPCASSTILGWDFLFSIANTTPSRALHSTPIVNSPNEQPTSEIKNEWNTMTYKERIPYVEKWWNLIKFVFPFEPWRNAWAKAEQKLGKAPVEKGKIAVLSWLYKVQKEVCTSMSEDSPYNSFNGLCKEVSLFSSGCGKSKTKKTKTCRSKNRAAHKTLRLNEAIRTNIQ